MMEHELLTESSDFDVDEFSLRNYLEQVIRLQHPTGMKFLLGWIFWTCVGLASIRIFFSYRWIGRLVGPFGYFQLDSPAFIDMHAAKHSKRINFKRLHSFD
jgi:hypothetical protein